MKQILSLMLLLFAVNAGAQRFESIMDNDVHELNGGARAALGGRSRLVISLPVPHGASAIIYTVTTVKSMESAQTFNLCLSLSAALVAMGTTGNTALASLASEVQVPEGTTVADIFLLAGRNDINFFEAKQDDGWRYYREYSSTGCASCSVAVPLNKYSTPPFIYIGIKNPSSLNGIKFTINASAVYDE